MRYRINLASQPYENARQFFLQWGTALAALFIVSALLVFTAAKSWRANHALNRGISEEQARLDKLNDQEKKDLAILNQDQNRDVRDRSLAINALIRRKEFSWTRIFSDLEKLMPTRLHVVSISPQLAQSDQIEIHMMVAGDSRDKAIELVQNMEKAADFRDAQILSETTAAKGSQGDAVSFEISAVYVPSAAAAISQAEKQQAENETPAAEPKTVSQKAGTKPTKGGRP